MNIPLNIDLPWSESQITEFLLSTDGGRDHPDLHVIATGKREFGDRTEFDVTVWGGKHVDTLRTIVTISNAGFCAASASFLPRSFEELFTRLDPGANSQEYSWKDKC